MPGRSRIGTGFERGFVTRSSERGAGKESRSKTPGGDPHRADEDGFGQGHRLHPLQPIAVDAVLETSSFPI